MAASKKSRVEPGLPPMEARLVDALPEGAGWQFEPKWDGFRCLAFRCEDGVDLRAKSGKPLGRFFPEVAAALASLPQRRFVLDGELLIADGGALSFEALQMRLHPAASRIEKLSRTTPAFLMLFDCLVTAEGKELLDRPLLERRAALDAVLAAEPASAGLRLSPCSLDRAEAEGWLSGTLGGLDGVIAKRRDRPYEAGERAMLKVKRLRTADCVIGGFRYGTGSPLAASLLLGLYDEEGRLDHVGFTTLAADEREDVTARLEKLREAPGFTGDAPGGPSRWSTERSAAWEPVRPELVVEVRYDHVSAGRFRHGTKLMRWRPDKAPAQCTREQLDPPASVAALTLLS